MFSALSFNTSPEKDKYRHILRIFPSLLTAALFSNLYLLDTEAGGVCNMH